MKAVSFGSFDPVESHFCSHRASPDDGEMANLCCLGFLSFLLSFVMRAIGRRQRGLVGFSAKEKARSGGGGIRGRTHRHGAKLVFSTMFRSLEKGQDWLNEKALCSAEN